jgi:DNA polymerase-1
MRQRYRTVTSLDEIKDLLRGKPTVAFDFETSPTDAWRGDEWAALDAHKSVIAGCSLATDEDTVFYVPLAHRVGKNAERQDELWQFLKDEIFESSSVMKIAHNLAFEAMFLYARGIVVQMPCYDTIAASQLTLKSYYEFRDLHDSGLKTLVPSLFGVTLPTFEEVTQGRFFDELDPADWDTCRYACADSDWTLKLYDKFNTWFDKNIPAHRFIVEQIESPTAVFTGLMKYNGVLVDQALMVQRREVAEEKLQELRERIEQFTGDIDIGENCGTNAFKTYLFDTCGLPVLKTTIKNAEAADDETIQLLTEYCRSERPELIEMFELVQEYRKWAKIKSTYIDGYSKWINHATGRIHPDLMPMGTDTGRFAARKPNLQNMPRKGNDPIGVRQFVIAPEGSSFLDFDFSQIELRVGAFYCRDPIMMETYRNGGDIHASTTSVIFGITVDEAQDKNNPDYKERRTIAKNVNFGTFYGLFPRGLQKTLKFKAGVEKSVEECENIINNLKAGYPALTVWQKNTVADARRAGYTETSFGRRRYLPEINNRNNWGKRSFAERCSMNTPIQGTAAEILKLAMRELIHELRGNPHIRPILQIHDELLFEVDDGHEAEAIAIIRKCMERQPFPSFDIPIVAEGEHGTCFGKLSELEDGHV